MAAEHELTPSSYIGHHLTFLQHPVGEGSFWTLNVDSLLTAALLGVVGLGFLWWVVRGATSGVPGKRQAFAEDLDESLALPGDAGSGSAHHPPEKTETDNTEQRRSQERIHVQRPERALSHRVLEESEVMADVGARRQFMLGGHCGKLFLNSTFREPVLPW